MSNIENILIDNEVYPENFPEDVIINITQLDGYDEYKENGRFIDGYKTYTIIGAFPGSFSVIDKNGYLIQPIQQEIYDAELFYGTKIDFQDFEINENDYWKIRFHRGLKGEKGNDGESTNISKEEIIQTALTF